MAHLLAVYTNPTLGLQVRVNSFGYDYTAEVIEVKPRTLKVRYQNAQGNVWTPSVKRTDVAAPTEAQKDATARGVKTRELKSDIRVTLNHIEFYKAQLAKSLDDINAYNAKEYAYWQSRGRDGSTYLPWTEEQYTQYLGTNNRALDQNLRRLAGLQEELDAHLAR